MSKTKKQSKPTQANEQSLIEAAIEISEDARDCYVRGLSENLECVASVETISDAISNLRSAMRDAENLALSLRGDIADLERRAGVAK